MRNLLIAILLLLPGRALPQKDVILVKAGIYRVIYSQSLEQPIKINYDVLCTDGKASRKGMDFYTNDSIKTSDDLDYANNEYDKGHMAPAADFNCTKEMLIKTFSYLNCALQEQNLNRGVWKELESRERELAKKEKVSVQIICVFSAKSKKLKTGATVPDGFHKVIKYGTKKEEYYFPNIKPTKKSYSEYTIK